jgi:SAM-dependent methyltransferase
MMQTPDLFERLIADAERQPFSGWDFSWLDGRWNTGAVSWNYGEIVCQQMAGIEVLLDMGTGGGEFLSSLIPLPKRTFATEAYSPNVRVAKERLEPLGVCVVEVASDEFLPFVAGAFDLLINRHESYSVQEVHRILKPNGRFITQQVGGRDGVGLNELLQEEVKLSFDYWTLDYAVRELEEHGFSLLDQKEEFPEVVFHDVGAVAYYLKAVPWQIPNFSIAAHRERLQAIHRIIQEKGPLVIQGHRFYLEANKQRVSS